MTLTTWYFTFGVGSPHRGTIQPIVGDYEQARELMIKAYGRAWCGQYPEDEARRMIAKYGYKLLPVIGNV